MVFLSPSYLSWIFKKVTGKTILEYIIEMRLEMAKELILNRGDLNIEQVGKMVGFNSPAYFVQKFRETYGNIPKKYRQMHIKTEKPQ